MTIRGTPEENIYSNHRKPGVVLDLLAFRDRMLHDRVHYHIRRKRVNQIISYNALKTRRTEDQGFFVLPFALTRVSRIRIGDECWIDQSPTFCPPSFVNS